MNATTHAEIRRQLEAGLAQLRAGKPGLAESHLLRVVKLDPTQADAWHLLGVAALRVGNAAKAVKHQRRALAQRPDHADAWNHLGVALRTGGEHDEAAAAFQHALDARPNHAEALYNLALLHEARGAADRAEACYRQLLGAHPESVAVLSGLGNLLARQGRAQDGIPHLRRALELERSTECALALASAHLAAGEPVAARTLAGQVVSHAPALAAGWTMLGTALRLMADERGALEAYARASTLDPGDPLRRYDLGQALAASGDDAGAWEALSQARAQAPTSVPLRWSQALLLPTLVPPERDVDVVLARFDRGLASLAAGLARDVAAAPEDVLSAVAGSTSYPLHYLPRDTTALQCRYGELIAAAVAATRPAQCRAPDWRALAHGGRVRVGFVSSYFSRHTVSRYFADLAIRLDRDVFECHVWHTDPVVDTHAQAMAASVEHFEQITGGKSAVADAIRARRLDVLVFPDIGMDPAQQVLGAMRLAPVQLALYGHPVTTGLATIDAYLSGDALEPDDAQAHYRERLIRLPGLGAAPRRWPAEPERGWFDAWRDARPTLLCLQGPSKLTPAFDRALVAILARSGGRVVFFDRGGLLMERYLVRLDGLCTAAGIERERCVSVLPARAHAEFLGAIVGADLVLDTPWFSGGATSLDTLSVGTPVVAWESPMARGRQTSAMLRMLGLPELVAGDADAYVERALTLLARPDERATLAGRIRARNDALFDATDVHAAFARTLLSEVRSVA